MKFIRDPIKRLLASTAFSHDLFNQQMQRRQRRALSKKIEGTNLERGLLTREAVLTSVANRKESKGSTVCHVIGSGWSLLNSLSTISAEDFVIGFNYAAIADISFDLYFFEFGGPDVKEIALNHLNLARDKISDQTDLVLFKNIWEAKNDPEFIVEHWLELSLPIQDHLFHILSARQLERTLEHCLNDNSSSVPQACSTVVTAAVMAYQAGFKTIVIHGLDFGGHYFYEDPALAIESKYLPPVKKIGGFYGRSTPDMVHPTASSVVGMKEITPVLGKLMASNGVNLCSGTNMSPSAKLLPTYSPGPIS